MQRKLNEEFIDSYCEKFVEKIIEGFFVEGKNVITGKEILDITPSKQVNFFVVKLLFRYWQDETKKLESPFFNYQNEEVKHAMIQFMNVLSQHIEIQKTKFKILLNHALRDTIYLAIAPEAYVEFDLESRGVEEIKQKTIEGTVKYLKIHKKEISDFLSDMKGLNVEDVIDELAEEFDDFDTTSAASKEFALLSEILPIEADKVLSDDPSIDEFDDFDEEEDDDEKGIFEQGEEDLVVEKKRNIAPDAQPEEEIVLSSEDEAMNEEPFEYEEKGQEVFTERLSNEVDNHIEEESSENVVDQSSPIAIQEEEDEHFSEETLNNQFETPKETIADQLEKEKINQEGGDLMKSISLNDRYRFIQDLFNEDKNEFEQTIHSLEQLSSFDESVEYIVQGVAKENKWNMQSDSVKELLKIIFRKFR